MIYSFTGPSGAGKTSIVRCVLSMISASLIVSYVVGRKRRDSDIPGEYRHVWRWWFELLRWLKLFIWTRELHGNSYGTIRRHVNRGLANKEDIYIMIISPDKVAQLWEYALERGCEDFIKSYYITSSPGILNKHLESRGDSEFERAKRLKDCRSWDLDAEKSGIPYRYIKNDSKIEDAALAICSDMEQIKSGVDIED